MVLLDGRKVATEIYADLKGRVDSLRARNVIPKLVAFNVGDHEPSIVFLKIKAKKAAEVGIGFDLVNLNRNSAVEDILRAIESANSDPTVSAITFQLPLPAQLSGRQAEILNSINPIKDVDLLTEENKNLLANGQPRFLPPTAQGILRLLEEYKIDLKTQRILVVGQGELVGKPISALLAQKGLSFKTADSGTKDLDKLISQASLIITATGQPALIRADNVQSGVIIVDAGTAESDGKLVGDVDPMVFEKASYITPVPGGVGPMTVAQLLSNVVEASERG